MSFYNKNKKIIKFDRVYFKDERCLIYSHNKRWGVNISNSIFYSPSSNSYAPYFIDLQVIMFHGMEICEGDILEIYDKIYFKDGLTLERWYYAINDYLCGIEPIDIKIVKNIYKDNKKR